MESLYAASKLHQTRRVKMLICQCNMITSKEIEDIVLDLLHVDPWQLVVPAKVYGELNRRAKCSGCVPNVVDIITKVTEEYHLQMAANPTEARPVPPRSSALRRKRLGGRYEGRSTGHRAA